MQRGSQSGGMRIPKSTETSGKAHPRSGLTPEDVAHLRQWIGKTERTSDRISGPQVAALAATVDRQESPNEGDVLPPLWHWLFFQTAARQSELGVDGHPRRGVFLPPVSLPRRMWAGGRLQFQGARPLRVGQDIVRHSIINSVDYKEGRGGGLVFVSMRHTILDCEGETALTDEQDIVYRGHPTSVAIGGATTRAPPDPHWTREIRPDASLLFRYSALTFNGHRIHYDRTYATDVEGYPGLVVQGPLIATLLVELLHAQVPAVRIERFSFRAVAPLFDTSPFLVCGCPQDDGRTITLWAQTLDGCLAMSAAADVV
jgi:3-methylfumaryl-CoA hydratase